MAIWSSLVYRQGSRERPLRVDIRICPLHVRDPGQLESKVGNEPVLAIPSEVKIEERRYAIEPLIQGRAVQVEACGCFLNVPGTIEEHLGRAGELPVLEEPSYARIEGALLYFL